MAQPSVSLIQGSGPRERTLVLLEVSGRGCAIPVQAVQEIVPAAELSAIPEQPPLLEGFLDLAGTALPVVRLDRLFDWPLSGLGLYDHILVLRDPAGRTGLLVNRVLEVRAVPGESLAPVPAGGSLNGCAEAEAVIGGRAFWILSPGRILLEQERRCLAQLQARAQERLDRLERPPV